MENFRKESQTNFAYAAFCVQDGFQVDKNSIRATTKMTPAAFQVRDNDGWKTNTMADRKKET